MHPSALPEPSKVRPWLRGLAWIMPGVSAPAAFLLLFLLTYGRSSGEWAGQTILAGWVVLTLGCAFFDARLCLPSKSDPDPSQPKTIARRMAVFCLGQLPLVPLLGLSVATTCSSIL